MTLLDEKTTQNAALSTCPAGKTRCDAVGPRPCGYSKEGLCDYPHFAISAQPMTAERRKEIDKQYGVSDWSHTFDSLRRNPKNQAVFDAFTDFALDPYKKPFLVCYGGTGNGKSHLLEALVIEWARKGINARIQQFVDVLDNLKASLRDKENPWRYDKFLNAYCHSWKFILWDDVGMGSQGTDYEISFLEQVVVTRFKERLPTVIITNGDITQLPDRVVSRARDRELSRLVFNEAPDERPKKAAAA